MVCSRHSRLMTWPRPWSPFLTWMMLYFFTHFINRSLKPFSTWMMYPCSLTLSLNPFLKQIRKITDVCKNNSENCEILFVYMTIKLIYLFYPKVMRVYLTLLLLLAISMVAIEGYNPHLPGKIWEPKNHMSSKTSKQ